ncbi:MAG TPA: hypothetical protein PKO36_13015, partial [Candidatus Hydrogenedentes bacterium]|nr:hypothetical protein [Candidatus Hydrogenedentota bacterium]
APADSETFWDLSDFSKDIASDVPYARIGAFYNHLAEAGLGETYEARHARLIVDYVAAMHARAELRGKGRLPVLPEESQRAAEQSYIDAANRLASGLKAKVMSYDGSSDPEKRRMFALLTEILREQTH